MKKLRQLVSLTLCLAALMSTAVAYAAGGTAYASTQAVEVDGKKIEFQMYALRDANGNATNYVKLRDVAHVLNGTPAQFSVGWDGSIRVTTGQPYADTGAEMTTPYSGNRAYRTGSGAVLVDGKPASLEAIVLTDDKGGDYTYFKLRDLGTALGFTVDWSAQRGVMVSTSGTASLDSKPVEVTTLETKWGTGYYVKDNGFGTGYLNNGKPITEENVLELLAEAEKIWPDGIKWTDSGTYGNNWYEWSGPIVDSLLLNSLYRVNTNYCCGGFASMLSDYIFGRNNNPFHRVTDTSAIRAGDVIVMIGADGNTDHISFAVSSAIKSDDEYPYDRVWTADGNVTSLEKGGVVSWPDYEYGGPASEFLDQYISGGHWEVWSRYPE